MIGLTLSRLPVDLRALLKLLGAQRHLLLPLGAYLMLLPALRQRFGVGLRACQRRLLAIICQSAHTHLLSRRRESHQRRSYARP